MPLDPQVAPVAAAPLQHHVFVCTGKSCSANNSEATLEAIKAALKGHGLLYNKKDNTQGTVIVTSCGSVGLCKVGPAVLVYPEGVWYYGVTADKAEELVAHHFIQRTLFQPLLAKQL
jgi:(2Fe-2S) ferredoxin